MGRRVIESCPSLVAGFQKTAWNRSSAHTTWHNCCRYQLNHPFNPMPKVKDLCHLDHCSPSRTGLPLLSSLIITLCECSSCTTYLTYVSSLLILRIENVYCHLWKDPFLLFNFLLLISGPRLMTEVFITVLLSSNFPSQKPGLSLYFIEKFHARIMHVIHWSTITVIIL